MCVVPLQDASSARIVEFRDPAIAIAGRKKEERAEELDVPGKYSRVVIVDAQIELAVDEGGRLSIEL